MGMVTEAMRGVGGSEPGAFGKRIMELAERLAQWSEISDGLTCTYLSPAHRSVAAEIRNWMRQAGLITEIDAAANVIGRYAAADRAARTVIMASHYDTVRNAGKYDGRLGILTALVLAEHLTRLGRKLPFHLDVIAFSEEEGVRFSSSFLGSRALAGRVDGKLLERRDADGHTLAAVMRDAGLDPARIPGLARRRENLMGYLEVHIEQGPVLLEEGLPIGIVSAIAGSVRSTVTITGTAGHAGTVPMSRRQPPSSSFTSKSAARRCPRLWALSGSLPSPTARSTSFRVAANSRSIFAPATTRRAMPPCPTSRQRSPVSRQDAASSSRARKCSGRPPCAARRACSRSWPMPCRAQA